MVVDEREDERCLGAEGRGRRGERAGRRGGEDAAVVAPPVVAAVVVVDGAERGPLGRRCPPTAPTSPSAPPRASSSVDSISSDRPSSSFSAVYSEHV